MFLECCPQLDGFALTRVVRGQRAHRGMHHHQFRLRVDEHRLAVDAEQCEGTARPWEEPSLIPIAEERGRLPRHQVAVLTWGGCGNDPVARYDLVAVPGAVVREHEAK